MSGRKVELNFKTSDGKGQKVDFNVKDGVSPYEKWVTLPANKGKSKEDYIESLRGTTGPDLEEIKTTYKEIVEEEKFSLTITPSEFAYANEDVIVTVEQTGTPVGVIGGVKLFLESGELVGEVLYENDGWSAGKLLIPDPFRDEYSKTFKLKAVLVLDDEETPLPDVYVKIYSLWITFAHRTDVQQNGYVITQPASVRLSTKEGEDVEVGEIPIKLVFDTPSTDNVKIIKFQPTGTNNDFVSTFTFADENVVFDEDNPKLGKMRYYLHKKDSTRGTVDVEVKL